ncbi:3'-5' RNA exonuclease complex component [Rhodosporidiobolus nylandii]
MRLLRTAVRGADEIASPSSPSSSSRFISHQQFKPTPARRTPSPPVRDSSGAPRTGLSRRRRGALVEVDAARLASVGGRRGFASSAAVQRVAEESLAELGEDGTGVSGGYDDAEGTGEVDMKGKGRGVGVLKEGDYVESTRYGAPLSGVYLGRSALTANRIIVLGMNGEPTDVSLDSVTFVIPSFVDPALAKTLAPNPSAPADELAFDSSHPSVIPIIQSLRKLEMATEAETQVIAARGINNLYRILLDRPDAAEASGSRKPRPPSYVTPSSALKAVLLGDAPLHPNAAREERLLAVHRILLSKPEHFVADPVTLRATGRFDLRPRDEVDRFEQVRDWVRYRSPEVRMWAEKAARLREWGRAQQEKAKQSGGLPSLEKVKLPEKDKNFIWTSSDLAILAFFRDTLGTERLLQEQPHMALAPTLVKLVDEAATRLGYTGWGSEREVKKTRLREFLAEVGAVAPWENWTAHERSTGLQDWESRGTLVERALSVAAGREQKPASRAAKQRAGALASTDMYQFDPHDSIRHDFGNAKVYTIDDVGASELDDGISLAPGPLTSSGKKTHWVHVHVADPTALLHPGHLLAKLARLRDHTEYFPEKTWAMLPESFVFGQKLSLGAGEGGSQRVLSLGIRIEEETGEVVDSEVKVGVVRNVMRLTYGAVDKTLGYEAPEKGRTLSTGPPHTAGTAKRSGRVTEDAVLEQDEVALTELRTLHNLAAKLLRRRVESSAIAWNFPRSSVSVSPSHSPLFTTPSSPSFFASSPRVELHLPSAAAIADTAAFTDAPASLIVSEFMVAANRAAAKFAVERELGVPFRQQGGPASPASAVEAAFALRNPNNGFAPGREILKAGLEFTAGTTLATPGPHWPMGINDAYGYVQVTSPLRRYSDLFAHYQLKSALLPPSARTAFAPVFTGAAVQSHLDGFNAARKARYRLSEAAEAFWALWVVKHKLDLLRSVSSPTSSSSAVASLSDDDHHTVELLSSGLTALALRAPTHSAFDNLWVQRVIIPQLGVRGTLMVDKAEMAPPKGEEVPVRIEEILLSGRSSVVVGLRR